MEHVESVMNLVQGKNGADIAMLKDLKVTLKIGQAETRMLTNLFNNHKLTPFIVKNALNGYLSKNFKKLVILLGVVLVKFIQQNGLKDLFVIEILKIKDGKR